MIRKNIKLFKMNDYDWVAAESAEQANEWYIKEIGIDKEEQLLSIVEEEPIDTVFLFYVMIY